MVKKLCRTSHNTIFLAIQLNSHGGKNPGSCLYRSRAVGMGLVLQMDCKEIHILSSFDIADKPAAHISAVCSAGACFPIKPASVALCEKQGVLHSLQIFLLHLPIVMIKFRQEHDLL